MMENLLFILKKQKAALVSLLLALCLTFSCGAVNVQAALNGLKTVKGVTYYYENGEKVTGWVKDSQNRWRYFSKKDGSMYHGLKKIGRYYYYFGAKTGYMHTGWKTINGKRYYFGKNGRAYTGAKKIEKVRYDFGSDGVLQYTGKKNLSISSDCAILVEAESGKVIYGKSEYTKHANASTTKIMTCILALENCSLSEKVSVSANAAAQEATKLYMKEGDSFYLKDLLYSLMLPSHNDTAVAIAEHVSGSVKKFVKLMNKKAKELGCTSTNFVTPNGLDSGKNHYTTASDLAKIACYAWKNKTFRKIVKTRSYDLTSLNGISYHVTTTNRLLGTVSGILGMKTGYTRKAGQCFVGAVRAKNGKTYIFVTLGASSSGARWSDAQTLAEYAYNLKS